MTGRTLNWYWKTMWAGVSPVLIISLFVFYLSDYILTGTLQYQAWDASQVPAGCIFLFIIFKKHCQIAKTVSEYFFPISVLVSIEQKE